ncbi:Aromatic ring-opening dioxygenase LigA OS=Streptomyces antimycoticus OX=68175 GN=SSPO_056560 PE=4 SV=1 [Streptomyces antimycoticus]
MGIESEKLVYDYLSRVGDLAQQQGLSSGERMRLVSGLRADIDHRRTTGGADSPAGVKRILSKLGSPADVVAAAGGRPPDPGSGTGAEPGAAGGGAVGGAGSGAGGGASSRGATGAARAARDKLAGLAKSSGLTGKVPTPREEDAPGVPGAGWNGGAPGDGSPSLIKPRPATPATPPSNAASPPHLAGEDELSPRESNMDWWHVEAGPFAQSERRDAQYGSVEGFTGGIEIPELLGKGKTAEQERQERREAEEKAAAEEEAAAEARAAEEAEAKAAAGGKQRGALRRVLLGPGKAADQPTGGGGGGVATWLAGLGPVLLVAVGLLVAGAVMGNIIPIAFGWVIAYYGTYRHSPAGAKWASLGIPGLVAAGAGVWLWGRAAREWGQPIPEDGWKDALTGTWPFVVRGAAIASVLFLLWRARRRKG